jgi:hypothetical protein
MCEDRTDPWMGSDSHTVEQRSLTRVLTAVDPLAPLNAEKLQSTRAGQHGRIEEDEARKASLELCADSKAQSEWVESSGFARDRRVTGDARDASQRV